MKHHFKRLLCLCLMVMVLCPYALADAYKVTDAATVRMDAVDMLHRCAFDEEYSNSDSRRTQLVRWEKPLRVYVGGNPTSADMDHMEQFFTQLQLRVPLFPSISFTTDEANADVCYYFVPLKRMGDYLQNYTEGNWGYVSFWWNGGYQLTHIEIGIATDVTSQKERNHLIMEEFINGSGITNDHEIYSDSISYQKWTTTQSPSELDWAMLNLIYSPFAHAGMSKMDFTNACYDYIFGF